MATGHAAFAITVEKEDIVKQDFSSFKELESLLTESDVDFDAFAQIAQHVTLDYGVEAVLDKEQLEAVQTEFEINTDIIRHGLLLYNLFRLEFQTKYGIDIYLNHHNGEEEGDRDDDVDGAYFAVEFADIYTPTAEALALDRDIPFDISQFVIYN